MRRAATASGVGSSERDRLTRDAHPNLSPKKFEKQHDPFRFGGRLQAAYEIGERTPEDAHGVAGTGPRQPVNGVEYVRGFAGTYLVDNT